MWDKCTFCFQAELKGLTTDQYGLLTTRRAECDRLRTAREEERKQVVMRSCVLWKGFLLYLSLSDSALYLGLWSKQTYILINQLKTITYYLSAVFTTVIQFSVYTSCKSVYVSVLNRICCFHSQLWFLISHFALHEHMVTLSCIFCVFQIGYLLYKEW